jgi:hypothetical protein
VTKKITSGAMMPSDQKDQTREQALAKQIAALEKIVAAIELQEKKLKSQKETIRAIEINIE